MQNGMSITNEKMIYRGGKNAPKNTTPIQKIAQHPIHAPPVGLRPYRPQQQRRGQDLDTRVCSEAVRRTHQLLVVGDTGAPRATQRYAREQCHNDDYEDE